MQDLRLVMANEPGSHLVFRSPDGEKYQVAIDDRLRAAVRGDRALLSQLDAGEGQLRPREIQARIRAGETAEQIARSAGVHVDRVRRFEGPVLAEREHIATLSQQGALRRSAQADPRQSTLAEAMIEPLRAVGLGRDDVDWDAWRREDGRWSIQATYDHDGLSQVAEFVFDPATRTVGAENNQAKWLSGDLETHPAREPFVPRFAPDPDAPRPLATAAPSARTRRPVVPAADDASERTALDQRAPAVSAGPAPADGGQETLEVAAAASIAGPDPTLTRRPPDVIARSAPATSAEPAGPKAAAEVVPPPPQREVLPPLPPVPPAPARRRVMESPTLPIETTPAVEPRRTGTENARRGDSTPPSPGRSGGRSRRASVPSWDDILIGTRPRD